MLTSLAGHAVGEAQASGAIPIAPDDPASLVALAALVIVASATLLTEREYERWGFALFGVDELARKAAEAQRARQAERCEQLADVCGLSPREREVLGLIVAGHTAAQISEELCVAPGTLKSHTQRIYRKCGVHRRDELAALLARPSETAEGDETLVRPSPTA